MAATEWTIISEKDLDEPEESGGYIRSYCQCHHDNRAPSISINTKNGFGHCFRCGEQIVVRELNPEAAVNIQRGQEKIAQGIITVRSPKSFERARSIPKERAIDPWKIEEVALLRAHHDSMIARMDDKRARDYIAGRGLSTECAMALGVGYVPDVPLTGKYKLLARWADHIIFPVHHPVNGMQFAGRSLKFWQPGMDEAEQKKLLEDKEQEWCDKAKKAKDAGREREAEKLYRHSCLYRRWRKTHANGWFNYESVSTNQPVFVEGPFDALALIEAGITNAVAVVGTAITPDWIPKPITDVTIAFDGDTSGREKSALARDALYIRGFNVNVCPVPDDNRGKDWSERYRLHGVEGLAPLQGGADRDRCQCGLSVFDDEGTTGGYDEQEQYTCSRCNQKG